MENYPEIKTRFDKFMIKYNKMELEKRIAILMYISEIALNALKNKSPPSKLCCIHLVLDGILESLPKETSIPNVTIKIYNLLIEVFQKVDEENLNVYVEDVNTILNILEEIKI